MANETIAAIIVAAGSSSRMGRVDKLWLPLSGSPVLEHSVAAFASLEDIARIMLVLSPEGQRRVREAGAKPPWDQVIVTEGGLTRADSVYAGLSALGRCDIVLIHDGARPLVTPALIQTAIASARESGAAIPAIPLTDTVKEVDEHGYIVSTPNRATLRAVQTPQAFRYGLLMEAYQKIGANRATCTDDAMLLERLGIPVSTFLGDPHNLKITTSDDVPLANLYLEAD